MQVLHTKKNPHAVSKQKSEEIKEEVEEILQKLPTIISDHVTYHKQFEERFKKEDKALQNLADLQRESVKQNPKNLEYRANPYNQRTYKLILNSQFHLFCTNCTPIK